MSIQLAKAYRAILAVAALQALPSTLAYAQKSYDPGASDTEIKIGQTMPYSGPASAVSTIGKVQAAYFRMLNERGGINGRKINLISYDDSYNPAKTVEQVRKLVESDEVLLMFQMLGASPSAAAQKYLNGKKVPQLLISSGADRFSNYKEFPWSMGFNVSFQSEGHIFAKYILANYPNAKIGVLYQNGDFGRDYLKGLKDGLGAKAASMIVSEASHEVYDPTIDSQIVKLKSSGADLLFNASTSKFATQAIKKTAELGWKPVHILNGSSVSVTEVLQPAGLENSKGIISLSAVAFSKNPSDPQWKDDPGMKRYFAFMEQYYPAGEKTSLFNAYGYAAAQMMEHILIKCGDELTRANVMKVATNLKNAVTDITLPGAAGASTSPTDYRMNKEVMMMQWDGQRWARFGPIITDDLQTDLAAPRD